MSTVGIIILCVVIAVAFFAFGAFFARNNGEGTDFDQWADKRDLDWDKAEAKLKEAEGKGKELLEKIEAELKKAKGAGKKKFEDLKEKVEELLDQIKG